MIILTHPCAGKTYWARRDKRVKDPSTKDFVKGDFVFVTLDHRKYESYNAAVIVPEKILNRYIQERINSKEVKEYNSHKSIYEHRERVIKCARKQGLTVYSSIEEILK